MSYYATEIENCICMMAGDTLALAANNTNCDGTRIQNIAGSTIDWAIADYSGNTLLSGSIVQPVDADYVTVPLTSAQTATLGGKYQYQITVTNLNGEVMTVSCGCIFVKKSLI